MQILQTAITRAELAALAENTFGDMIKCVADVKQGLLAIDAELHADLERLLLENDCLLNPNGLLLRRGPLETRGIRITLQRLQTCYRRHCRAFVL